MGLLSRGSERRGGSSDSDSASEARDAVMVGDGAWSVGNRHCGSPSSGPILVDWVGMSYERGAAASTVAVEGWRTEVEWCQAIKWQLTGNKSLWVQALAYTDELLMLPTQSHQNALYFGGGQSQERHDRWCLSSATATAGVQCYSRDTANTASNPRISMFRSPSAHALQIRLVSHPKIALSHNGMTTDPGTARRRLVALALGSVV